MLRGAYDGGDEPVRARAVAAGSCAARSCDAMTALPPAALSLAGFTLAHAAWSLADADDGDLLCPLAVIEQHDRSRRLTRFEADTQEEAIIAGKTAMREASGDVAAWAFAREGAWRKMGSEQGGDVLAIDFWASGMPATATLMQPFYRSVNGSRFRIGAVPTLVVGDQLLAAAVANPSIEAIMQGVQSHAMVATLWPGWL
jgi:hypothetical protein